MTTRHPMIKLVRLLMIALSSFASVVHFSFDRAYAQQFEAGNKIRLFVRAEINSDSMAVLSYRYILRSSPESKQDVWTFRVIFSASNDSIL